MYVNENFDPTEWTPKPQGDRGVQEYESLGPDTDTAYENVSIITYHNRLPLPLFEIN